MTSLTRRAAPARAAAGSCLGTTWAQDPTDCSPPNAQRLSADQADPSTCASARSCACGKGN